MCLDTLDQHSQKLFAMAQSLVSQTWVDGMNPGLNLGNTLEGIPDEGDWGNPLVVPSAFNDVKKAGFRVIRLPGKMLLLSKTQSSKDHSDMGISLRHRSSRLHGQFNLAPVSV